MIFLFSNFGEARLSARLPASAEQALIAPSEAFLFPVPQLPGQRFSAILYDGDQPPEVVWCRNNGLDGTLTLERGKESSVARTWGPGTTLLHTLTSASIEYFVTSGQQEWIDQLLAAIADLQAQIDAEVAARQALEADMILRFDQSYAAMGQNTASIQLLNQSFADMEVAWTSYQLTMNSRMDESESLIEETITTFNDFETAQAEWNVLMEGRVGDAEAQIIENFAVFTTYESATASTLDSLRADVDDSLAQIDTERDVRVTQTDALASAQTSLSVQIGDVAGDLAVTQLVVADIEGNITSKYGVALTAGGVFAGFQIMAGTGPAGAAVSQARFAVADFQISTPGGNKVPFRFDTLEATAYLQNVKVDGADIKNASIGNAAIGLLAVGTANIQNLAVASGKIADAAITTAKIGDLQVETIKIANFAITDPLTALTDTVMSINGSSEHLLQTLVVVSAAGERVDILASYSASHIGKNGAVGQPMSTIKGRIYRNGVLLQEVDAATSVHGIYLTSLITFPWSDLTPPVGPNTYELRTVHSAGGDVSTSEARDRFLSCTRVKK